MAGLSGVLLRTNPVFFSLGFAILGLPWAADLRAQDCQAVNVTPVERTLEAQSFANAKLLLWQNKLNLGVWKISLLVVRADQLRPETLGNVHWNLGEKSAVIRVLDPADYHLPLDAMLRDIEFTVVHELVHLEIAPILGDQNRTPESRTEEERTVNSVAGALIAGEQSGAPRTGVAQDASLTAQACPPGAPSQIVSAAGASR